ncbi:MAG: acetyl-CoA C-acyltransferase [bacterium]|nr:acetyl-CoA C-acyltransferase [bacterium]
MNRVALVGGVRTPFVKAGSDFSEVSALDLSKHVVSSLVKRLNLDTQTIDELIFGSVLLDPRFPNLAREIVLRTDLARKIPAHFVSNNCISGLVALNFLADGIRVGRIKVGIGGGVESMSLPALTVNSKLEKTFIKLSRARTLGQRLGLISSIRPSQFVPRAPSPKEPSTGLTMGEHMEITTKEHKIPRDAQDQWAFKSHHAAAKAQASGFLTNEIEPLNGVAIDNIIRGSTTLEKLASLKPVFDRGPAGTLTAGNSSPLTDGASAVCLMSEAEAQKQNREVLCYIEGVEFSALHPSDGLLMAPALAVPRLLQKHNLKVSDIDLFEVHEAFAAQVLANLKAWEEGWAPKGIKDITPLGKIPEEKININGSSIAIGHPFAATGGRIITSLAHSLKRTGKKRGVISVCAAGGMAAAVLVSR